MNAAFGSARSGTIRVTERFGITGVSIRVKTTDGPSASAFFDTKSRPKLVAAHSVPASSGDRSAATIMPPARSAPNASLVRSPGLRLAESAFDPAGNGNATPSGTQSPQTAAADPPLNR